MTFRLILLLAGALGLACGDRPKETGETVDSRPALLQVQPSSLSFSGSFARDSIPVQQLTISNQGGDHLTWSVAVSREASWLRVSRDLPGAETRGVEGPGRSSSPPLNVSVNSAEFAPGLYNATIEVTSNGGNATVSVSLTVKVKPQG